MSTMIAAGPLTRISAPLPPPRDFTLLDAATTIPVDGDRWRAGAGLEGWPVGPVYVHDGCTTGTMRIKEGGGEIASAEAVPFTAYLPASCTARSVGPQITEFRARLRQIFEAIEATAAEKVLVGGEGLTQSNGDPIAYLGDANMDTLGSGAVPPTEGLALLEQYIATVGAGMIHVPPATATYWAAAGAIQAKGRQMVTKLGTPVAIGAGYIGAQPDGEAAPGDGEDWAFASGPVAYYRETAARTEAQSYAQALDRSSNTVSLIAERDYLLLWVGRQTTTDESHLQAGVLIDRLA